MGRVYLLVLVITTFLLFTTSSTDTRCKLRGKKERKTISKHQQCLKKGFKSTLTGCTPQNGSLSKRIDRKCRKVETQLKSCEYTCPSSAITLTMEPLNIKKEESEIATFTCITTVPKPTKIYWQRFVLNSDGYKDITELATQDINPSEKGWKVKSELKVGPLGFYDGGNYRCSLLEFPATAETFLAVKSNAALTINPLELKKEESETATFTCITTVPKPTKIYWQRFVLNSDGYKDITELATQDTTPSDKGWKVKSELKVGPLGFYDGGNYRCSLLEFPATAEAFLGVQTKPKGNNISYM